MDYQAQVRAIHAEMAEKDIRVLEERYKLEEAGADLSAIHDELEMATSKDFREAIAKRRTEMLAKPHHTDLTPLPESEEGTRHELRRVIEQEPDYFRYTCGFDCTDYVLAIINHYDNRSGFFSVMTTDIGNTGWNEGLTYAINPDSDNFRMV